jgi:hypothetical protein
MSLRRQLVATCAATLFAFAGPAVSQAATEKRPGPNPKEFLFHKTGIAAAQAEADLLECAAYSVKLSPFARAPDHVPLESGSPTAPSNTGGSAPGGLVGSLIVGLVNDGLAAKIARGNMRRCMHYRGYQRFAAAKPLWTTVNTGDAGETLRRHAAFASGARPVGDPLAP